jgi:hypothetical protein
MARLAQMALSNVIWLEYFQARAQDHNRRHMSSAYQPTSQDDLDYELGTSLMNGDSVTLVTERDADLERRVRERVQRALDSGHATKPFWANRIKEAWPYI